MLRGLPIRWRLTIFYSVTILVIVIFMLLVIVAVSLRAVTGTVEDYSRVRAQDIARYLSTGATLTNEETEALVDDNEYISVRDATGRISSQSVDLAQSMSLLSDEDRDEAWVDALAAGHGIGHRPPRELYVYAAPYSVNGQPAGVVEVWKSIDETGEALIPFSRIVVVVFPLALILAIVGAYFQARSALKPVDAITQAAREITEGDLSKRLPVTNARDELGRLASTFNGVLARLETAFAAKEETLAAQRRFVADASHELRTPLTSILGYARMLKQWGLDDPATARESVVAIEQQASRLVDLAEGMLSLARGDEELRLERGWHDLGAVAAESFAAARAAANGRVGLIFRPPQGPVMAVFDRNMVEQVAAILLDNAVKYTPPGGTVTLEVGGDTTGSTLSVTDTGGGIAPDHLPHIFERFYRADPARAAGGAGLGLAIAGQIAARHGGRIDVATQLGRGSRFTLWLPNSRET
jgi:signal transduction histidine kinase